MGRFGVQVHRKGFFAIDHLGRRFASFSNDGTLIETMPFPRNPLGGPGFRYTALLADGSVLAVPKRLSPPPVELAPDLVAPLSDCSHFAKGGFPGWDFEGGNAHPRAQGIPAPCESRRRMGSGHDRRPRHPQHALARGGSRRIEPVQRHAASPRGGRPPCPKRPARSLPHPRIRPRPPPPEATPPSRLGSPPTAPHSSPHTAPRSPAAYWRP